MKIILKGLPKISLNLFYSGTHWAKRKSIKDTYRILIKNQFKDVLRKDKKYLTHYTFYFRSQPLDASNCVGMLKLIEDVIFEDDKHDMIDIGGIKSRKAEIDFVEINVEIIKE